MLSIQEQDTQPEELMLTTSNGKDFPLKTQTHEQIEKIKEKINK